MLDPLDYENRPYLGALSKTRRRAFIVLTLERVVSHTWRPLSWVLFFCGLWMMGLPEFLGKTPAVFISISFFIGLIVFIRKDILTFKFPNDANLDRAIETKTALPRGQIALIEDNLANPKNRYTRSLWNTAQKSALHTLKALKTPNLRATLVRLDPFALRFLAILFFISGYMVSSYQWQNRIYSGLFPVTLSSITAAPSTAVTLWVEPPDYTRMDKIQITGTGTLDETLQIPEGSVIKARIQTNLGQYAHPILNMGDISIPMEDLGEGFYSTETMIQPGSKLSITQSFFPRATWPYDHIIDTPPEIYIGNKSTASEENTSDENGNTQDDTESKESEKEELFEIIEKAQIRFPLRVKDDYSVKELKMSMNIADFVEEKPLGEIANETRLIVSAPDTELKISPVYDMTWHTWAGLPVTFKYTVFDHKKQSQTLEKISIILPERNFEHPLAKSVIAMRKELAWQYRDTFNNIAYNLETLLGAPDYFQNNPVTYLAIKTASARLKYAENKKQADRTEAAKQVIKLLWAIAISVEDGNLSLAMRELRDAQRELENAMRDPNTSQDEIDRLMDNLREKMNNYFAEMQRDLQKRMENGEEFPEFSEEDFGEIISPDALSKLMEEIEQAMRDGDEQKAQELMSKLQRMMEMMDSAEGAKMPKDMEVMKKGVNELQELIERQEELLEQTERRASLDYRSDWIQKNQNSNAPQSRPLNKEEKDQLSERSLKTLQDMLQEFGMNTAPPTPEPEEKKPKNKEQSKQSTNETERDKSSDRDDKKDPAQSSQDTGTNEQAKTEQDALRYVLGQLMLDVAEHLDDIPETMGEAEQEMRKSAEQLGKSNPEGSIPHQEEAIRKLKDSQDNLNQQFRQRMRQMVGIGSGTAGGNRKYDPLGRPYGGKEDDNGETSESDVKIPDEAEKKRIEEIIKELRDKSSDRSRPREELEYYRRLLRQF